MAALTNAEAFFVAVRKITGPLNGQQVNIINKLLFEASSWGKGWLAYGLATGWHEARLMPIEEWGRGKGKPYGKPGRNGGQAPYGRGLVQLTHDSNYERADAELKLKGKLIKNYALALDPDIAVKVLVRGMSAGWFTGKSLSNYIGKDEGTREEFTDARRIINGTDKDALIAGHALRFQDALIAGGWK